MHDLWQQASRTQRLVNGMPARYDDLVIVGASEKTKHAAANT
jgi:thymidine kinase